MVCRHPEVAVGLARCIVPWQTVVSCSLISHGYMVGNRHKGLSMLQKTHHIAAMILTVGLSLGLAGCYDEDAARQTAQAPYSPEMSSGSFDGGRATGQMPVDRATMARAAPAMVANDTTTSPETAQSRKIAQSQQWVFEIKPDALERVWTGHRDICVNLDDACEIVHASLSSRGPGEGARYGQIEMRVDHAVFDKFLQSMAAAGPAPVETSVTREDKTLQWVDLHSRLRNAESLRDRLQAMVKDADREHKLSDLLALERELNRVQSTIDSMQSQSRVLAQQTDKVRMSFQYRSTPQTIARDIWDPIRHAWHNMGSTFSDSVGSVLLFVAGTVPWLVVLIPGWIFGRWALRKLFARWLKKS